MWLILRLFNYWTWFLHQIQFAQSFGSQEDNVPIEVKAENCFQAQMAEGGSLEEWCSIQLSHLTWLLLPSCSLTNILACQLQFNKPECKSTHKAFE
jgi:hypothetical protein